MEDQRKKGICITCLNDAVVDIHGQCDSCHLDRKVTDVWGQKIMYLVRVFENEE